MKPPVQRYASGRKCKLRGCREVLGRWNPHKYCFSHLHEGLRQDQLKDDLVKQDRANKKKKCKKGRKK